MRIGNHEEVQIDSIKKIHFICTPEYGVGKSVVFATFLLSGNTVMGTLKKEVNGPGRS